MKVNTNIYTDWIIYIAMRLLNNIIKLTPTNMYKQMIHITIINKMNKIYNTKERKYNKTQRIRRRTINLN